MCGYNSFEQVRSDAVKGVFRNESELRQAFVEALKNELLKSLCNSSFSKLVNYWLIPSLDEILKRGKPDIRVSNLIIEVKAPKSGLQTGRVQLKKYMSELYEKIEGRVEIFGVVTDGVEAELWILNNTGFKQITYGDMPNVMKQAINIMCSQEKLPIVSIEDLIKIFGV